jgi:hypothetical protein
MRGNLVEYLGRWRRYDMLFMSQKTCKKKPQVYHNNLGLYILWILKWTSMEKIERNFLWIKRKYGVEWSGDMRDTSETLRLHQSALASFWVEMMVGNNISRYKTIMPIFSLNSYYLYREDIGNAWNVMGVWIKVVEFCYVSWLSGLRSKSGRIGGRELNIEGTWGIGQYMRGAMRELWNQA